MKIPQNLVAMLVSAVLSAGIPFQAKATKCKPVKAHAISFLTTTGCTSPIGLCDTGTISGNLGLNGAIEFFTVDSTAPGPSTAPNPSTTLSYSGILEITTNHGTLITRDTGVFDTSTGTSTGGFSSAFATVIDGTGKYHGASGYLFFAGKPVNGHFETPISGELCLP
jgi:hypothetical protein